MLVDAMLSSGPATVADEARTLATQGYDALWVGETQHDPFLLLQAARSAAHGATLGTSVAVAFARTPMTTAYLGYDMNEYCAGRFVLGLGTQVRPHIERRFSMPWSRPADRLREFVVALRAIWSAWETGDRLDFQGDFYTHTLMTPFFTPPRHDYGAPPIHLAGVGQRVTEVAGEVADGFFFHAFTTPGYLRDVTLPALRRGRSTAGTGDLAGFQVCGPAFVAAADTEEGLAAATRATRERIAFYASTPGYRAVLEHHGWGDLQPELTALSKQGRWAEMGGLVDVEILSTFAVVGAPEAAGRALADRYSGLADRLSFYAPYPSDPAVWPRVLESVRAALTRPANHSNARNSASGSNDRSAVGRALQ